MKLQQLKIHNIASIEDAVIDFDAQPLADSDVFLITGKTGAGKSTLLDAICLALYADTPRLEKTEMQGETQDGNNTIKIKSPRQLMRRNTKEAYVTLTFVGNNDVRYEASWSVAYARTGTLKREVWQLRNLEKGLILTKDKEIEKEIESVAVGLDFKQFCRTTLLAQGDFTRFLNSKDDDKAAILEKITGADIYTKIGTKVYSIADSKRKCWELAKQLVENTTTLSEEQVAQMNARKAELETQNDVVKQQKELDQKKWEWLAAESRTAKDMEEATTAHKKALDDMQSDDFKLAERTVIQWHSTIEARGWLSARSTASNNIASRQKEIDDLAGTFKKILDGMAAAKSQKNDNGQQLKKIDSFLEAEKEKVPVYEKEQTIVANLNTIASGRTFIAKQAEVISAKKKELDEKLEHARRKSEEDHIAANTAVAEKEAKMTAAEKELTDLSLPTLRKQRDDAKTLIGNIGTANERLSVLTTAKQKLQDEREELASLQSNIEQLKKDHKAFEPQISAAKVRLDTCQQLYDRQKETIAGFARTMRQSLHVGDECPVCRQKISAGLPHEEDLKALVDNLEKERDKAKQEYDAIVGEGNKQEAQINADAKSYDDRKKRLDDDKSVEEAERKLAEACKKCGIEAIDDKLQDALTNRLDQTTYSLNALEKKIKEGEQKEKAVNALREELDTLRKERDCKKSLLDGNTKKVEECKNAIKSAQELSDQKQNDATDAEGAVANAITSDWAVDWKASPTEFARLLSDCAKTYREKNNEKQTLELQQERLTRDCEQVEKVVEDLKKLVPAWGDIAPTIPAGTPATFSAERSARLLEATNKLHVDTSNAVSQLNTAKESYKDNNQRLTDFLSTHEELHETTLTTLDTLSLKDIEKKQGEVNDTRTEALKAEERLKTIKESQQKHQQEKPAFADGDTAEALKDRIQESDSKIAKANKEIGAIDGSLKQDADNKLRLGKLIADADAKRAEYTKWSKLNRLIGSSDGKAFRKIAQSYVLAGLIHSANHYMKTLTDRYTLKVQPGSFVILIEDAYQGFATRAASTISGGESFLVSLALALALSDFGNRLTVDTLFIDEGFGTLSGEPLQNAINTLRTLHTASGRHVGIISHVEELQERIPVQIQVLQEGHNSSSQIRIIPE